MLTCKLAGHLPLGQGSTACVCLAPKKNWIEEAHDEDFEKTSKWSFVSGISRNGVSEYDVENFQPVKHGIADGQIENWLMDPVRRPISPVSVQS